MNTTNHMQFSKFGSLIYNFMVKTSALRSIPIANKIWHYFWSKSLNAFTGAVLSRIHGKTVALNYGYTYPLIVRRYVSYNAPIIELVHSVFHEKRRRISIVDIGAAIGDTMLCLLENCPEMIGDFYCIDGDDEFFNYLEFNMRSYANAKLINALLSSQEGYEKCLVRIHRGTSSIQGEKLTPCITFDSLVRENQIQSVDLIKLDADGFDGKILTGSVQTLASDRPAIFFEWHPQLCEQVQNDWHEHFVSLTSCGYDRFLWFDNYGKFSHFLKGYDITNIELMANLLIKRALPHVAYYDVIALHEGSSVSVDSLSELKNAGKRKTWI